MGGPWPNLVIAGVPKAGTTSLHRYLDQHPEIFMCPVKESTFFSHTWDEVADDPDALEEAKAGFLELFEEGRDHPVRGDTTPGYLQHPRAADRIAGTIPDVRILFVLRDPVERAHSWWLMAKRRGWDVPDFPTLVEEEIEQGEPRDGFLPAGRYGTHLERWLERFDRDQIKVMLFADLGEDTLAFLEEIAAFVDVDPDAMARVDHETVHNPYREPRNRVAGWLRTSEPVAKVARLVLPKEWRITIGDELLVRKPPKPPIEPKARDRLAAFYEPEVARAEDLLGRDLPELRASWDGQPSTAS